MAVNLVNAEAVSKVYGTRALLDEVSLGISAGDRIGVVGRNGDGKTTLIRMLAKLEEADSGQVTHTGGLRLCVLTQHDSLDPAATIRHEVIGDLAEHEWAGSARVRDVLTGLFGGLHMPGFAGGLDTVIGPLSGGERRRVALARLLVAEQDLIILDEPTNHLDVEGIAWLAGHLRARRCALVCVTHDRWFLDQVCTRMWDVQRGAVHEYEGGYADYVFARAERDRIAASEEAKRRNLVRKELAWLRRGAPARTSKPRFRIEAANELIKDVPPPRDSSELMRFASARLGKSVFELEDVTLRAGAKVLLKRLTWQLGPGERIALVGVNGAGKTSLIKAMIEAAGGALGDAEQTATTVPTATVARVATPGGGRGEGGDGDGARETGTPAPVPAASADEPHAPADEGLHASGGIVVGKTVRPAYLSQEVREIDARLRLLEAVQQVRERVDLGKGRELTAGQLCETFGFGRQKQWTPVGDLSGGERRRLQLLRLLMAEPNVLFLDEPTNDLDIETLTQLEDLLDGWPGTLVVISHDRFFVERTTDQVYALLGDGTLRMLPRGIDEYLERRERMRQAAPPPAQRAEPTASESAAAPSAAGTGRAVSAAEARAAQKELQRIERQLDRISESETALHARIAENATDFQKVAELDGELRELTKRRSELEERWLQLAEDA